LKVIATLSVCYVVSGVIILYLEFFWFWRRGCHDAETARFKLVPGWADRRGTLPDTDICLLTNSWFRTLALAH